MAYDLLIKNGRIIDGSGMPAFRGDVGVQDGKIAELGKLSGPAKRTIDAEGRVVAPGFVDNHCHYDAQVTWDPLCSFSPQHGATTVVFELFVVSRWCVRHREASRRIPPMWKRSRWKCSIRCRSSGKRFRNTWSDWTGAWESMSAI
jgi:N-acyl-D-aspartate/D-glutamate deacylase